MKKIYTAMSLPLALLGGQRALGQDERLNIVYTMSDDHSAQAISTYGSILSTACSAPNINRIGREGIRMGGGVTESSPFFGQFFGLRLPYYGYLASRNTA